eukprot:TRINITY_DN70222_c0_g1_i1.p1 TRINITY_DN70222_c0_g1~~TRINITY_DN70222_c0_g1_i1.p1  ORF type:complete len:729 (+),score=95.77 TRINITY_DN70222_c0_g1_i1:85-2271(+)
MADGDLGRRVREAFRAGDVNDDGFLDEDELRDVFVHLGVDKANINALLGHVGVRDRRVNLDMLCNFIFGTVELRQCKNGCGRSATHPYLTCCRTCGHTHGKSHGVKCEEMHLLRTRSTYVPAEWRGITVTQLRNVRGEILARCSVESWKTRHAQPLQPGSVSLYDLNHYVILPQTVRGGFSMTNVKCLAMHIGSCVSQLSTRARGKLSAVKIGENNDSADLHVNVLVGRFSTPKEEGDITVDGVRVEAASDRRIEIHPLNHCSFVDLKRDGPQKPIWFVSHWWGEPVLDFVTLIEEHARVRGLGENAPYWVCAYANDQHDLGTDVTTNPYDSSFYRAMMGNQCEGILLLLNAKTETSPSAVPFSRIWCAFELHMAVGSKGKLKLDVATTDKSRAIVITSGLTQDEERKEKVLPSGGYRAKVGREKQFPLAVLQEGLSVVLEKAQASLESDRRHILNTLACSGDLEAEPPERHPCFDTANQSLRGLFALAAWPQALGSGMVESMHLPEVLAADSVVEKVVFNLAGLPLDDVGIVPICRGLPLQLLSLSIDLTKTRIGDKALETLGESLQKLSSLKDLDLRLNCTPVGDRGLTSLASAFVQMPTITAIQLQMRETHVGDAGLQALAAGITALVFLCFLSLNFARCERIGDVGLAVLGSCLGPQDQLSNINANFAACKDISDAGMKQFARGICKLEHLERVHVTLGQTKVSQAHWKLWSPTSVQKRAALRG